MPATLMLMGETPGDHEDRDGHAFVGPAGHLLDRALADAGLARSDLYLTNAVKHFKFVRSRNGKVRAAQDAEPDRGHRVPPLVGA